MSSVSPLSASVLSVGYPGNEISASLDLSLERGVVTALIGRNGIGKSTLLKTLTGNLAPLSGNVSIEGKSLDFYSKPKLARVVAVVSNEYALTGGLRLREFVALGRSPHTGLFGLLSSEDRECVEKAMELVRINHKKDSFFGRLSDGERQKGMIARALAQQTPVIVMDEPFSFLDVASRIEILSLLKNIAKAENKTILFSTHEVTQALRMADMIWLAYRSAGNQNMDVFSGTPEEIIESGKIKLLFDSREIVFDSTLMDFRLI